MDEATLAELQKQEAAALQKAHQVEMHLHDVEWAVNDKSADTEAAELGDMKTRHAMEDDIMRKHWMQAQYDLEGLKQIELQGLMARQHHENSVLKEHELLDEDSLRRLQELEHATLERKFSRERDLRICQQKISRDLISSKQCFEETSLETKHEQQRQALRQEQGEPSAAPPGA